MSDERSRVVFAPGLEQADVVEELEELEGVEDLDADDGADTGAYLRASQSVSPPARSSSPPPIPAHVQKPATGATLPPPRAFADSERSDSAAMRAPSSGMFRIERTGTVPVAPSPAGHSSIPPVAPSAERPSQPPAPRTSAPPPPTYATEPAELKRALAAASRELREHASQIHRLRLMVRLREDKIGELEAQLRELRQRSERVEHELRQRSERAERDLERLRAQGIADDLKRITGIGPGFERGLHAIGVTSFEQIAAWTEDEIERVAREIRTTPRRIQRDGWVDCARALAAGGAAPDPIEPEPAI